MFGRSDERYRIAGGNERLPRAIAASLPRASIRLGEALTAIARNGDGTYALRFRNGTRLSTVVADRLTGKHKPTWTPFTDMGDHVVVVNAEKVRLTGTKWSDKMDRHHTGYPGGLRSVAAVDLKARNPERIVQEAVFGMLPKSKLGRAMRKKLKVYRGPEHPHQAQKPSALAL